MESLPDKGFDTVLVCHFPLTWGRYPHKRTPLAAASSGGLSFFNT
jgi:hypothetical protein